MSKNRIGFQLVDLQNKNLTSGATVTIHGLFNVITKAEGKPCVVTGLRIGNKNRNDEVVTFVKDNNKYVGAISDGTLEITSNSVKFTTVTPVSVLSEAVQTLNTEVASLNTAKANNTSLGGVELTNTATMTHTAGTYFIWGGQFVVATSDIDIGDTITDTGGSANVESTTIAAILSAVNIKTPYKVAEFKYVKGSPVTANVNEVISNANVNFFGLTGNDVVKGYLIREAGYNDIQYLVSTMSGSDSMMYIPSSSDSNIIIRGIVFYL